MTDPRLNAQVGLMDESVIREMTRVAEDCGAINVAQGFPELPALETRRGCSKGCAGGKRKKVSLLFTSWLFPINARFSRLFGG